MKCPYCGKMGDKVVDSRETRDGASIRRRRECLACGRRFTSYERIDEISPQVVKKDGRREPFERTKILNGLMRACQKRPVPRAELETMVDEIETYIQENMEREVTTVEIGEILMRKLQKLDKVAYVRFASVYRDFKDIEEFLTEINHMFDK